MNEAMVRRTSRWIPWLVLVVGTALTIVATIQKTRENERATASAVEERLGRLSTAVEERLLLYRYGLRSARGAVLVAGLDSIDAEDFRVYGRSRNVAEEFPGARGFGFIRRVPEDRLTDFLKRTHALGNVELQYRELAPHDGERFVIEFIEPAETNRGARGLDIASEAHRRAAAVKAGRTGGVVMTGPITLLQASYRPSQGVLVLLPVYRKGMPLGSPSERWAAVVGWSYAPLVVPEVLSSIGEDSIDWWVDDVTPGEPQPVRLFLRGSSATADQPAATRDLRVFERVWRLHAAAGPALTPTLGLFPPDGVFAIGAALTLMGALLAASLLSLLQRQREARARAEELGALRRVGEERERLAAVIEGTNAGVWEWNVQTGETRFNERWAEIVGYRLDELQPVSIETWLRFVHPDDGQRSAEALERHFSGKAAYYECEARMRHRDGHWVWVFDRGKVKSWTPDGQPEWMFGTHLDVSRHHAEREERAAGEALLAEMGELANVGGWSLDTNTQELRWTAQTRRIHGVPEDYRPTVEAAIGFYAPEAREAISSAVATAIETGQGWDLELPLIRADGRRIWVRAAGRAVLEDGRAVRLVGAFQDVTGDYLQRSAIVEAHERLDTATESARIGIWSYEPAHHRTVWNRQVFLMHGEEPFSAEPDYDYWASHLHPEDRARVEAHVAEAMQGRKPYELEYRVVWPDGSVHHIAAVARVFRDEAGETLRVIGINRDVTAEKRAEEELRVASRRLVLATESGGVGVWEWNLRTQGLWWDRQMYRLFGLEPESGEETHQRWLERLHGEDRQRAEATLRAVLEEPGKDYDGEYTVLWPDGTRRVLHAKARVLRDGDGLPTVMTGINWDVTSQRDLESALVLANAVLEDRVEQRTRELLLARDSADAANRAKSEFLANMSHELRTPLHGILGFAKLVCEEGSTLAPEALQRYATRIVKNGEQLLSLVDDLLDSAKIDYGNFRITPEPCDLMAVVRATVEEFAGRSRSDVLITIQGPEALRMECDPRRIGQVCRNLLANAIRLSPSDARVSIEVVPSPETGGVRVEVADDGPGIPENELESIFDRFAQSSKTKTGAGGTGLGLTISRSIAELHGGSLVARNRPDGGALFELRLPVTPPKPAG